MQPASAARAARWRRSAWLPLLAISSAIAAVPAPTPLFETSFSTRLGYDSNPTAVQMPPATSPDVEDSLVYAAGVSISLTTPTSAAAKPSLRLAYLGEVVRYENYPGENYATHRLAWSAQCSRGLWKFTGEGSTLFVAGATETLPSDASANANGVSLWRERRRQWQHRLKVVAQTDRERYFLRLTGTLLGYDYHTQAVAGRVPFADRSDVQGAADIGWKQNAKSLWLAGARVGHQEQETVPLPNCEFDYSNDYVRLVTGWEGKPCANTTATFSAGPNFRHFTGDVDSRVFLGGLNRTSLWFEGGFVVKPTPTLTLTAKAARMDWLSSTGKSAYVDTSAETTAAWTVNPQLSLRLTAKVHGCDYDPAVRDDRESLVGVGATLKYSDRAQFTVDLLHHRGWNGLAFATGREFERLGLTVGATFRL